MKFSSSKWRLWCRNIHRELSFFFAGMVLIYAVSGLVMNHRDTINPHYTVSRTEFMVKELPTQAAFDRSAVDRLMAELEVKERTPSTIFRSRTT